MVVPSDVHITDGLAVAVTVGIGTTVTVTVLVWLQPYLLTVSVYTPAWLLEAAVIDGSTAVELKPPGPVQVYVAPETVAAFSDQVVPVQSGLGL